MNKIPSLLPLIQKVQAEIQKVANPETKIFIEKYMKGIETYRGVKYTQMKDVFKVLWANDIKNLSTELKKELAHALIQEEHSEDRYIGLLIFEKLPKEINLEDVNKFQNLFEKGHLRGWATTDLTSSRVFKNFVKGNPKNTDHIATWKDSDNIWLQRASCVSFVVLAKHGDKAPNFPGFLKGRIDTCEITINNPERFVQLGTGWLLREIGIADKRMLTDFISSNMEEFSREGLRYAIEKLDTEEQKSILDKHKEKSLKNKFSA